MDVKVSIKTILLKWEVLPKLQWSHMYKRSLSKNSSNKGWVAQQTLGPQKRRELGATYSSKSYLMDLTPEASISQGPNIHLVKHKELGNKMIRWGTWKSENKLPDSEEPRWHWSSRMCSERKGWHANLKTKSLNDGLHEPPRNGWTRNWPGKASPSEGSNGCDVNSHTANYILAVDENLLMNWSCQQLQS